MSGGREKLNNFSKLKSIVSSGIKEKAARFKKAREERINQDEPTTNRTDRQTRKPTQPQRQQGQSTHKVMPQYGQKQHSQSYDQQEQSNEEIVIKVDVKKQNAIAERRVFNWLCRSFPNCFNPKAKKPLKIGISDDIQAQYNQVYGVPVDQFILSRVLKRYVGDQNYQKSVIELKQRFDLNGNPVEDFTEAHLEHASKRLEELKFKAELRAQGIDIKQYYEEKARKEAAEKEKLAQENVSDDSVSIDDDQNDDEYDPSKELND